MTWLSLAGLLLLSAFAVVLFGVLAVDGVLAAAGAKTVTEWALEDPARERFLIVAYIAGAVLGGVGLAIHLLYYSLQR